MGGTATATTSSSATTSAENNPNGTDKGRPRCVQCGRRRTGQGQAACNHDGQIISNGSLSAAPAPDPTAPVPAPLHHNQRPRRISKLKHRALTATLAQLKNAADFPEFPPHYTTARSSDRNNGKSSLSMEPPVLSFYGTEPVPLPTRFAQIKRSLAAGHEKEIEASWARLLEALRGAVEHIEQRGPHITPSIDFADISHAELTAAFQRDLKRYGLGVIRGVVPRQDAQAAIDETVTYLETKHEFKPPSPQDPTCFDFFWTPAQVRTRAHPAVLEAQRWVMGLWDNHADDRMATRFPISYADRLRIHGANIGGIGPDKDADAANGGTGANEEEQRAFVEQFGDFASSTLIAQVDNGSLERWEPDGYGRGGTYDAVFKGEWEKYDPWDPTHRVSATTDLYNGYGACSIFRMYQGVVALSTIEPGLIRLLPMPKLATAYFLLRPFFAPKTKAPERQRGPEWDAFLDASNWELNREYNTIIHGAVPGHAQRLTELWHPHLHLRRTLVTIPTLQTGDYIVWHPDLAYHMSSNPNIMASRAPTPPPAGPDDDEKAPSKPVSILVYVPAAPLTQTNALYLARQRKTFLRGHPSPDFDSTGTGLNSEATHSKRPGETEIAEVGGPSGLQAMGLAPFDVAPTPPANAGGDGDVEMEGALDGTLSNSSGNGGVTSGPSVTRAEAEVARLANIILFPDRYDFYMAKRSGAGTGSRASIKRAAAKAVAGASTNGVNGSGKREREEDDGTEGKEAKEIKS